MTGQASMQKLKPPAGSLGNGKHTNAKTYGGLVVVCNNIMGQHISEPIQNGKVQQSVSIYTHPCRGRVTSTLEQSSADWKEVQLANP